MDVRMYITELQIQISYRNTPIGIVRDTVRTHTQAVRCCLILLQQVINKANEGKISVKFDKIDGGVRRLKQT